MGRAPAITDSIVAPAPSRIEFFNSLSHEEAFCSRGCSALATRYQHRIMLQNPRREITPRTTAIGQITAIPPPRTRCRINVNGDQRETP